MDELQAEIVLEICTHLSQAEVAVFRLVFSQRGMCVSSLITRMDD